MNDAQNERIEQARKLAQVMVEEDLAKLHLNVIQLAVKSEFGKALLQVVEDEIARRRAVEEIRQLPSEHPDMVIANERAEEIAKSPDAVRMVMRYHGERHDLSQRVMRHVSLGRGLCDSCGHPIYFDDRPQMQRLFPARKWCVVCAVREGAQAGQPIPDEVRQHMQCPADCAWAKEHNEPAIP